MFFIVYICPIFCIKLGAQSLFAELKNFKKHITLAKLWGVIECTKITLPVHV